MAWVKLDDSMPLNPKVLAAGVDGFALDVAAIAYSSRFRTDGFIADHALPALFPPLRNPGRVADRLVEVGRWNRVEGGWMIHDFLEYQPSATDQAELSRKRADAGKRGGKASGRTRRTNSEATAKQKVEAKPKQVASTDSNPVPSRPVPTRTQPLSVEVEDALAVVASDASLARTRPRNPVWDTLAEVFGDPSTKTARSVRGKVVASLTQAGATPPEILRRVAMWPLHYPDATLTDLALEKHWDALARPPLKATTADVDRLRERAEHERRLREAEQKHAELRGLPS